MCLSSVFEASGGSERLVCEHVSSVVSNNGTVTLTDIMGDELVVAGKISRIDLVKNIIVVEACS